MTYFAVSYTYATDVDRLGEVRPEHRAFLASLDEVIATGPLLDTEPGRALLIFRAKDEESLTAVLDQDPFHVAGLIDEREILAWNPVIGVFAE